ncbi:MAG: thiolase family protein [Chloroflexi bacterium]|nr:thiolase family protein [Chloroflexota bacterium]MCY3582490.1 thiolase family protein [Chloroflexota bacterium]MCY3716116.1 thiolase family protein [Chloroflexota bacterium]MDE2649231.1 thiolase family protein [Chloroflexota bacterium]MYC55886.1 thiolase family protein [Chloroflexota bacterium]
MSEVVIVSALRSPIGKLRGALSTLRPDDMAALVIGAVVERAGIDPGEIEEVYFGCANQAGEDNRNIARMAALLAGLPESVAGVTVNRLCASGLTAVNQAARAILAGEGEVFVAGGVESMSRAPYSLPKNPPALGSTGNITAWDTALGWRYPNPALEKIYPLEAMGETAENIHELSRSGTIPGGEITREQQDRYALQSQQRAVDAINRGAFHDEILPLRIPQRKAPARIVTTDERPFMRQTSNGYEVATDMHKLASLRAAFRANGTVTAGNSSGINDGACALLLMSARRARSLGLQPLARWLGSAAAGIDPRVMGLGPVPAAQKLLRRQGLEVSDIDLVELNEAFAVQAIAVLRQLGISEAIANVNGGAIALGHPLGCSGARILTTLLHEMRRRAAGGAKISYGLAALCVGVGQGEATLVELMQPA